VSRVEDLELLMLHRGLAADDDTPQQFTATGGTVRTIVCAALEGEVGANALVRWDTGANAGRWSNLRSFDGGTDTAQLDDALPAAVANGDEFTLFEGGRFATNQRVAVLQSSPTLNVSGLQVVHAEGVNGEGTGRLAFAASGQVVTWQPPGGSAGPAIAVGALGLGDRVAVTGAGDTAAQRSKFLLLERTAASLPVADAADDVSLDLVPGAFAARVTGDEASDGVVIYRPFAIRHRGSSPIRAVEIHCGSPAPGVVTTTLAEDLGTGAAMLRGADLTGWPVHGWVLNVDKDDVRFFFDRSGNDAAVMNPDGGMRSRTAVAWDEGDELIPMPWVDVGLEAPGGGNEFDDPATRATAPSGVTFSCPLSAEDALAIGDMAPGDLHAVWLRIEIPAGHRPVEGGRADVRVRASVSEPN